MTTMTAVGTFADRASALAAVRELRGMGVPESQIGMIGRDDAGQVKQSGLADDPTGTRWEEGTGVGAAAGAATGVGLGLAVLTGLIPPLGPVVAGGALVALLASAGGGAAVGTVVGGLIGLGVPEDEARGYETDVTAGRTVVAVAGDRYQEAAEVLSRHGATVRARQIGT